LSGEEALIERHKQLIGFKMMVEDEMMIVDDNDDCNVDTIGYDTKAAEDDAGLVCVSVYSLTSLIPSENK